MSLKIKNENSEWIVDQKAIQTSITDVEGNFESSNVEGALRELAENIKDMPALADLEAKVSKNTTAINIHSTNIQSITNRVTKAEEEIEWLLVNGGGGGGTATPTITSTFKDCAIDKGQDVTIPIFFSSPNMGPGTAYIMVNNIEVDTAGLSQGSNTVKLLGVHLMNQTDNEVAIYAKDRAGIVSNQLTWTIIAGGIDLTSTFDYEVDYGITDSIRIPYTIDTGIKDKITTFLTINGNTTEYTSSNGGNFIDLQASSLGLGTHAVSMYSTVGKYTSRTLNFNIVIVSTSELYLSSTFVSGSEFEFGRLINVNYRLSKKSTEEFNVYLKIDDVIVKTQKLTVGSYPWTIDNLSIGPHKLTIQAISLDYKENKSLDLDVVIVEGDYTPIQDYKLGLLCDLNAIGKTNNDANATTWIDESGNKNHGKLVNFNLGTNGFINNTLVCDNDAYVEIPFSPWKDNAKTGSTIDLIYTPINSGVEDARVLDYTTITDPTSTNEIKPFKGVFADILMSIPSSASSGAITGKVNLDDESGEIHLCWVLDRENKFFKVYINGVLSRIMFLTDSGTGVNKVYEDFAIDESIFLNSTKGLNCGTNNIRRFRVYDHALTSEQVLQNHLANIRDFDKQKEEYDFNYNNKNLPKMYLTGDTTNMTPYQTVPMKIEYVSPDEEKYGRGFNTGIQNNPVHIQGTSSLQYVRHNYTIYLKDEYGSDMFYNPYGTKAVPENVFCLKADYVESSHANNTGLAKFINDCVYETKTPSQLDNVNCRTTICGFPIEVYINGEYLGIYNFNHDRYSTKSFGYDHKKFPNQLVYEINSNSDTSAGAFYRYKDDAQSSANISEHGYYKRDFNLIYGNRTTDNDSLAEIKTLVEWVANASTSRDLFRDGLSEHFNVEYLMRYYLTVLLIGAVDSLGKNMKLNTWDGQVWYPTFYDLDTVLGINNTGYLNIPPDVEIEVGSYNTSNSKLWKSLWDYYNLELKEEWKKMRNGSFTLSNLMKYVYDEQIKVIPPKFYNDDAQVKYLDFGSLYTYACHGNKEHQIKRWLRERIAYVDSMLGYFNSTDDMITVRMNKTGMVSFDVTPYIPLYFSVKWSNADGGTQTFKLKRGEKKTYYFNSTVATDQEVIIYHAKHVKRLDNLTNLNPKSCILSYAKKLTNVEIHSPILYAIDVTENQYLRSVNLEGCRDLGTVVGSGSSINLSKCKYLKYCNVYNTNVTEVQTNISGGSLREIYYPKTIQSINLVKQRLLETIGLPYGNNGEEVPTSLYTISIQECPKISKLNTSTDSSINFTFASMLYCNNLTIRNSLDLKTLRFDGFHRLKSVVIENMYNLEELGFNDMLPVGDTPTLKYIGLSNCPLLEDISMNCTSDDYVVSFDTDAILDFGGLLSLKNISSNCVIKGLKTLVVPEQLESMYFTNEFGTGYSSVRNIWVGHRCDVNTDGATPTATHVVAGYEGIDFLDMNLKNIDLGALVNIPKAINFSLSPTNTNPNFNKNRDGVTYKYLQPEGVLDLSNYTESLARFFNGVDLDKLLIICNNGLPQTDLSYCFYNSTFSSVDSINALLERITGVTNLDYCFYRTIVSNTSILNNINFGSNASMNYTFAECANITSLSNLVVPEIVTSVEGMFSGCPITTVTNATVNVKGSIKGLFKGCDLLHTISTLRIPNVTDVSNLFQGCISLSILSGFTLPVGLTNIDNLFNGCYSLTSLSNFVFENKITSAVNWYPNNLEALTNITINNSVVKLTNISSLISINDLTVTTSNISNFFSGTASLTNIDGLHVNGTLTSTANLFKDKIFNTFIDVVFSGNITDVSSMFENTRLNGTVDLSNTFIGVKGVTNATRMFANSNINVPYMPNSFGANANLTEMFMSCNFTNVNITLPATAINISGMFKNCINLNNINALNVPNNITNINELFSGCTSLTDISGITLGSGIVNSINCIPPNITTANNVTVKSSIIKNIFKGNATLKNVSFVSIPSNITDLSSAFENCTNLLSDIDIPVHITNVTSMFKGCIKMTHVRSNWSKTYDGAIITADCYTGCIGITHIDNYNVINFDGDCGLDYIQESWGGLGFLREITSVYVLDIPSDGYSVTYLHRIDVTGGHPHISWGDGNVSPKGGTGSNTYTKAGIYGVKIKGFWNATMNGGAPLLHTSFKNNVIRVSQISLKIGNNNTNGNIVNDLTNLNEAFRTMTKLQEVDLSCLRGYNNLTSLSTTFMSCTVLNNIIGLNELNVSNVVSIGGIFNGCKSLNSINISNWNVGRCTSIGEAFNNCSGLTSLDLSTLSFSNVTNIAAAFNGCSNLTTIKLPNIDTVKTPIIEQYAYNLFSGCSSLITIEGLNRIKTGYLKSLSGWFNGCSSVVAINLSEMDFGRVTSFQGMFYSCTKLTNVDFRGVIFPTLTSTEGSYVTLYNMFGRCKALTSIDNLIGFTNFDFISVNNMSGMFGETNVVTLDTRAWNTQNVTSFSGIVNGNMGLRTVHFNFNGIYNAMLHTSYDVEIVGFHNCTIDVRDYTFPFIGRGKFELDMTNVTITNIDASGGRLYENPVISAASLVKWLTALADRTSTTTGVCTIGNTNLAKLTPAQIAIATNKNWTVV